MTAVFPIPKALARRLIAGLCSLLLPLPGFGQTPAQASAQTKQEPPVLRVTTHLVQVSVIVQDKKGEPVAGLTKDDFSILDQKQPQTISTFSVESIHPLPPPAEPLPPNLFSNRFEQKSGTPASVTVILLDALNTKFEDMAYARQQIIKFLGQLQPQDRVALYSLTAHLTVLHDFTSDATRLLQALDRFKGHSSTTLAASEPDPDSGPAETGIAQLDAFLSGAFQREADFFTTNRARQTAGAIEAIANHVARLPGRKNLIWVSGGFPFYIGFDGDTPASPTQETRTFNEYVERAARALNNANLAIYPVDARGLIGPAAANRGFSAASRGPRRGGLSPVGTLSPSRANFDTMNILADRTGGRAFYNTNDIQGSIRRAIEDSRLTYVLGYYPSHGAWDGKFREIKVQMNRPGLHLRYRRGYFALPDVPLEFKQREALLREAVGSPLQATGLGLNIRVQPVDVPGARTLKMDLQLDPRDISLQPEGDRWVGAVDLLFVQIAADGRQITGEAKTFNMRLQRQTYDSIMKDGLVLTRTLPLADGAAQVRVVTRDATSGALGSVTIPLDKLFSKAGS